MGMAKHVFVAALAALFVAAAQGQTPKTTPKPRPTPWPNKPPSVKLAPSADKVTLAGCGEGEPVNPMCPATSPEVKLSARATDPDGDTMLYTYTVDGGRVTGEGPEVTLDLAGVTPGVYKVNVEVDDGNGGVATDTAEIEVSYCSCDRGISDPPRCPVITVSCTDSPVPGGSLTFTANVSGIDPDVTPTFKWKVSAGQIKGGQGTSSITVDASNAPGQFVTAILDVGGYGRDYRDCATSASCTVGPGDPPVARKLDEYGPLPAVSENARLGNFAVELRNEPSAQGYLVCYGGRRSRRDEAGRRCGRAKNYTGTHFRGIDSSRLVTVDGGFREAPVTELWLVPSGADPPQAGPTVDPSEVRPPRRPRGRGRR